MNGDERMDEPSRIRPSERVSQRFATRPNQDTAPELALRQALHKLGYRYRVNAGIVGLPRKRMDLVFTRRRVVVLIDGCFWHGCPDHLVPPKRNAEWWAWKVERNRARDRKTSEQLAELGWRVVRVWEHQVLDGTALPLVVSMVGPPRPKTHHDQPSSELLTTTNSGPAQVTRPDSVLEVTKDA